MLCNSVFAGAAVRITPHPVSAIIAADSHTCVDQAKTQSAAPASIAPVAAMRASPCTSLR